MPAKILPRQAPLIKEYLDPEETLALEEGAESLRDKLLFRLLRILGCRISEVLGLRVEDIDFIRRRVTIIHLKTRAHLVCPHCSARLARGHTFCPGCGKKVEKAVRKELEQRRLRQLPVDLETLGVIKNYIDRGGLTDANGHQFLFNISRQRAWQIFRQYSIVLGLPELINSETGKRHHVSPHKMRDSFAVNAMKVDDSGDGQRLLQEHLGHSSFNTTAKYRKIAGREREDWFEKVMGGKK